VSLLGMGSVWTALVAVRGRWSWLCCGCCTLLCSWSPSGVAAIPGSGWRVGRWGAQAASSGVGR
jgi:hypothetical protein